MANMTPTVLIVSGDPDVTQVASALQLEGISSRCVSSLRELNRAMSDPPARYVAVLDGDLAANLDFPAADLVERLRSLPLLVLLPPMGDMSSRGKLRRRST